MHVWFFLSDILVLINLIFFQRRWGEWDYEEELVSAMEQSETVPCVENMDYYQIGADIYGCESVTCTFLGVLN